MNSLWTSPPGFFLCVLAWALLGCVHLAPLISDPEQAKGLNSTTVNSIEIQDRTSPNQTDENVLDFTDSKLVDDLPNPVDKSLDKTSKIKPGLIAEVSLDSSDQNSVESDAETILSEFSSHFMQIVHFNGSTRNNNQTSGTKMHGPLLWHLPENTSLLDTYSNFPSNMSQNEMGIIINYLLRLIPGKILSQQNESDATTTAENYTTDLNITLPNALLALETLLVHTNESKFTLDDGTIIYRDSFFGGASLDIDNNDATTNASRRRNTREVPSNSESQLPTVDFAKVSLISPSDTQTSETLPVNQTLNKSLVEVLPNSSLNDLPTDMGLTKDDTPKSSIDIRPSTPENTQENTSPVSTENEDSIRDTISVDVLAGTSELTSAILESSTSRLSEEPLESHVTTESAADKDLDFDGDISALNKQDKLEDGSSGDISGIVTDSSLTETSNKIHADMDNGSTPTVDKVENETDDLTPSIVEKDPLTTAINNEENEMDLSTPTVDKVENEMDVSTSTVEKVNKIDLSTSTVDQENDKNDVSTPTVEKVEHEMDLSTPTVEKVENEMDLSTPTVEKENEMDLSTPTVEKENEMDLTTPTVEKEIEMDLTTPTVTKVENEIDPSSQTIEKVENEIDPSTQTVEKEETEMDKVSTPTVEKVEKEIDDVSTTTVGKVENDKNEVSTPTVAKAENELDPSTQTVEKEETETDKVLTLTVEKVEKEINDVSTTTVSKVENDKNEVSIPTVEKVENEMDQVSTPTVEKVENKIDDVSIRTDGKVQNEVDKASTPTADNKENQLDTDSNPAVDKDLLTKTDPDFHASVTAEPVYDGPSTPLSTDSELPPQNTVSIKDKREMTNKIRKHGTDTPTSKLALSNNAILKESDTKTGSKVDPQKGLIALSVGDDPSLLKEVKPVGITDGGIHFKKFALESASGDEAPISSDENVVKRSLSATDAQPDGDILVLEDKLKLRENSSEIASTLPTNYSKTTNNANEVDSFVTVSKDITLESNFTLNVDDKTEATSFSPDVKSGTGDMQIGVKDKVKEESVQTKDEQNLEKLLNELMQLNPPLVNSSVEINGDKKNNETFLQSENADDFPDLITVFVEDMTNNISEALSKEIDDVMNDIKVISAIEAIVNNLNAEEGKSILLELNDTKVSGYAEQNQVTDKNVVQTDKIMENGPTVQNDSNLSLDMKQNMESTDIPSVSSLVPNADGIVTEKVLETDTATDGLPTQDDELFNDLGTDDFTTTSSELASSTVATRGMKKRETKEIPADDATSESRNVDKLKIVKPSIVVQNKDSSIALGSLNEVVTQPDGVNLALDFAGKTDVSTMNETAANKSKISLVKILIRTKELLTDIGLLDPSSSQDENSINETSVEELISSLINSTKWIGDLDINLSQDALKTLNKFKNDFENIINAYDTSKSSAMAPTRNKRSDEDVLLNTLFGDYISNVTNRSDNNGREATIDTEKIDTKAENNIAHIGNETEHADNVNELGNYTIDIGNNTKVVGRHCNKSDHVTGGETHLESSNDQSKNEINESVELGRDGFEILPLTETKVIGSGDSVLHLHASEQRLLPDIRASTFASDTRTE